MSELIEYQVRPLIRYAVTRYEEEGNCAGSSSFGVFDNYDAAHQSALAMAEKDRTDKGWEKGDERLAYAKYRSEPELLAEYIERQKNGNRVGFS